MKFWMNPIFSMVLTAIVLTATGCSGSDGSSSQDDTQSEPEQQMTYDFSIPTAEYTWDVNAGDPNVSAEMGGPGFTGEGWETQTTIHLSANPEAPKGGEISTNMPDWPATVRMTGKDWNTYFNYFVADATQMPLLTTDPITLKPVPSIATHWQISEDKKTYRYRINPAARWSDGTEIISEDVVASWKLRVDPTILSPSANVYWGRFEQPKAISKYIVEVTVKEDNWRNFLAFSTAQFWPAKHVSISGKEYLDKYQFAYVPFSGPYEVLAENIKTGTSITLTRRDDWWAKDIPSFAGMANLEAIRWVVVKSQDLAYEKVKKGEIDYYVIPKAQWWAEELPTHDAVKRGLLVRQKIYNQNPVGTGGHALNLARPPLNDLNIRKALQYLYPNKRIIETLYYNEYEPLNSYWQYGDYQNTDNKLLEFDPFKAVELIEAAGWTEKNGDGYRIKDGVELSITLQYASALSERALTIYQEELKDAGIRLELQLLTPATRWKNLQEKEYQVSSSNWGAMVYPNPRSSWHSDLATQKNNNNVTGFANEEVDALIAAYDIEYDGDKRADLVRQMDAIIYNHHPYVLQHYKPAIRIVFWNKYALPKWGAPRFGDDYDVLLFMWSDAAKTKEMEAANSDDTKTMDPGNGHNRFWQAWLKDQKAASASTESAPEPSEPANDPADQP